MKKTKQWSFFNKKSTILETMFEIPSKSLTTEKLLFKQMKEDNNEKK